MTQGERVKKVRKSLGLTMDMFGEKLGVGKSAISKVEHDQCNLSEQMAKSICREFHVNYTWLTTGKGDSEIKTPTSTMEKLKTEFDLDDFSYNLVYQYLKLDSDQRQAIRDFFYNVVAKRTDKDLYGTVPDTQDDLEKKNPPVSDEGKVG